MQVQLNAEVVGDGAVALSWQASQAAPSYDLLIIRTGSVPAYTSVRLSGDTTRYQITHLSRHQRYRLCVAVVDGERTVCSDWLSVTPRAGLEVQNEGADDLAGHLARVQRFIVMPQEERLTAYWETGRGFVDQLQLQLLRGGRLYKSFELEPEVRSLSIDAERGVALANGEPYTVRLLTRFAALGVQSVADVRCTPALMGQERAANSSFPQDSLVYPFLALGEEVAIFDEEEAIDSGPAEVTTLSCGRCGAEVDWRGYRLRCARCGAEYIPNGRGDFLDVDQLRFGTCRCCLPKKILIQKGNGAPLTCAHSGKEHIRVPGQSGYLLIEDLPHGLCQCCRPRRPLVKQRGVVRCSKSDEEHRREQGRYALVPSEAVFDASAIDELLDAGMAEICSTGVSRGR